MLARRRYAGSVGLFIVLLVFSCSTDKAEKQSTINGNSEKYHQPVVLNSPADIIFADSLIAKGERLFKAENFDSSRSYFENAVFIYEKHSNQMESLKKWGGLIQSYNRLGAIYRRADNPTKAMTYLNKALEVGKTKIGEKSPEVADTYHLIGNIQLIRANYDNALKYYNKALTIRLSLYGKNNLDVANSLINIAVIYRRKADYRKALEMQMQSMLIQSNLLGENDYKLVYNYHNLGYIYTDLGDYDKALEYLYRALKLRINKLSEQDFGVASNYNLIGVALQGKGDFEQAFTNFYKAWKVYIKVGKESTPDAAKALTNIGRIYSIRGDYTKALDCFYQSLKIKLNYLPKDHPDLGQIHQDIGNAYEGLQEHGQAYSHFKKASDILQNALGRGHPEVANVFLNVGNYLMSQGQTDKAFEYYNNALNIYLKSLKNDHLSTVVCYVAIANTYREKGRLDLAEKNYLYSLRLAHNAFGNVHPRIAENYKILGDLYLQKNEIKKALSNYRRAIPPLFSYFRESDTGVNSLLQECFSKQTLLRIMVSKASALVKLSQQHKEKSGGRDALELAISTYDLAAGLIDSIRFSYETETSKFFLVDMARPIYEQAISAALKLHKVTGNPTHAAKALSFAQKSKSVVLSEFLQESRAKQFAGIPDSLLINERQLKIDLAFYETELQKEKLKKDGRDSLKIVEFEGRYFDLSQRYNTLLKKFAREYPRYYSIKYASPTASVPEIQKALSERTALVEYFVGDSTIVIFTITKNAFAIKTLPQDTILLKHGKVFREALKTSTGGDDDYKRTAHRLHQALIKPIEPLITGKDLLIIPDGFLSDIPFEAFLTRDSEAVSPDYSRLPYLMSDHAISYAYSVSLWLESARQKREASVGDFLALAPVFPNGLQAQSRGAELLAANNGRDTTRAALGALPMTRNEVLGVKALFDQNAGFFARRFGGIFNRRTKVYLEDEASERKLKSENLANYRYVHLATHGFANYAAPDLSGLALAVDPDTSEDDVLYLREIYNLKLNADLVVLSLCESGTGKLSRGEGLLGLSRGFIYAGAKNLLVSLWKVNDTSTARLMREFYAGMLAGLSKAEALRRAKLHLINSETSNPKFAMPHHWGPFILIGQ